MTIKSTSVPVLAAPNFGKSFVFTVDALVQEQCSNKKIHYNFILHSLWLIEKCHIQIMALVVPLNKWYILQYIFYIFWHDKTIMHLTLSHDLES